MFNFTNMHSILDPNFALILSVQTFAKCSGKLRQTHNWVPTKEEDSPVMDYLPECAVTEICRSRT
jgi:hypothetical protein